MLKMDKGEQVIWVAADNRLQVAPEGVLRIRGQLARLAIIKRALNKDIWIVGQLRAAANIRKREPAAKVQLLLV
jgi:hypothetical protein